MYNLRQWSEHLIGVVLIAQKKQQKVKISKTLLFSIDPICSTVIFLKKKQYFSTPCISNFFD